jgi:hypothetical protein
VLGHRFRFSAEGSTLCWSCSRGCGAGGTKRYASPQAAQRYARALDRDGVADLGRRAPLGLFPLRLARWWRRRRAGESDP